MTENKLQELLKDRETMPVFDETIFESPDKSLRDLGFTDDDIQDLVGFIRWHINQHNLGLERQKIVALLRARRSSLSVQRRQELLRELESIKSIPV